jgi:hypothetical protein
LIEANLIAKEISRKISLQIILDYIFIDSTLVKNIGHKNKIQVQIIDYDNKLLHIWSLSKFRNRYFFIKEIFDRFLEEGHLPLLSKEEDPFWDPSMSCILGKSYARLNNLAYLIDCPIELNILGNEGISGTLKVNLMPTDEKGVRNLTDSIMNEDDYIEDPGDLEGRRLDFLVKIESASFKDQDFKDCYVEYELLDDSMTLCRYKTNIIYGIKKEIKLNYLRHHHFKKVNEKVIQYLLNGVICFRVCGFYEKIFASEINSLKICHSNILFNNERF